MGAEEIVFDWGNLSTYYEQLDKVGGQAAEVEAYARDQVFNKSGFDYRLCVLQPLSDMMDTLGGVFGDVRATFDSRWADLIAALQTAERDARASDEASRGVYDHGRRGLGGV